MEEEDGMEKFEIEDSDLDYALNPGRRHFQSKNQATYGIWADDSDEEGEGGEGRSNFRSGGRSKKDYSRGVAFVSGGIKHGNKVEKPNDKNDDSLSQKKEEPIELRPPPKKLFKKSTGGNVFAGMRTSAISGTVDASKFADWAKFGKKEVLMNMMKSMGYEEGRGLGAEKQGIVEPVQAAVRAGRGAVGAYGKESTGPKFGESAADTQRRLAEDSGNQEENDGRESKKPKVAKGGWKKAGVTKVKYKTIDDVITEGGSMGRAVNGAMGGSKVIDMTGPEQRVYSGYDSFAMKTNASWDDEDDVERTVFDVAELRHNLNLLVDLTEEQIRRNNNQLRNIRDETVAFQYEFEQKKTELTQREDEQTRMKDVYEMIERFASRKGPDAPNLTECQSLFLTLKSDYMDEYVRLRLEDVAVPCVLPHIQSYFARWEPLNPDHVIYGKEMMGEWRAILARAEDKNVFTRNFKSLEELSAYDRVLWDGWLPYLRKAALQWDPRTQMEVMLRLLEEWLSILPEWMKENVLEQIIIPRMETRVSDWNPTEDEVPIHSWLVPWLELLGDRLQPVLAPVRQKIAKALRVWEPADDSALAILRPWVGVWAPVTMSAFLSHNVVPKLERVLDQMELDPRRNQHYKEWTDVTQWIGLVASDTIANILTRNFFPRWYNFLCSWLDSPGRVADEVLRWYNQWEKRMQTPINDQTPLIHYPTIKENMRRAVVAFMESTDGRRVGAPPPPPPPPPPVREPLPPPPPPLRPVSGHQLSMKDMIEMQAGRYGLTYIPQVDRQRNGKQVFWFGTQSIYLDGGVVYVMDPLAFEWRPISMNELLVMAGAVL